MYDTAQPCPTAVHMQKRMSTAVLPRNNPTINRQTPYSAWLTSFEPSSATTVEPSATRIRRTTCPVGVQVGAVRRYIPVSNAMYIYTADAHTEEYRTQFQ